MPPQAYIERLINLLDPAADIFLRGTREEALVALAAGDVPRLRSIRGQYALVAQQGKTVRMARTIGRPLRYFLAKQADGPCLVVADRIDAIHDRLKEEGLADQFHPSYTRMVPAHHILELQLVGCPDPNPVYRRYFAPQRNRLPADVAAIGHRYIAALAEVCQEWLDQIDPREPIGVLFSGGIDSGSVLLVLYHLLLSRGESPSRLKAFTLTVDGDSADARQAREFLHQVQLEMLLETVDVSSAELSYEQGVAVLEDYKPLDVQAATVGWALCSAIRRRYPDWKYLVDGDGGDENLKDYPIEENPELTIRSVLNNLMLYQEGWGVDAIKHSLTYSGGQSRGHVRSYAPARLLGFQGFSPYALPDVIEVAEGIPFIELTDWDHERLYALKGQIVRQGVRAVTGIEMPVFPKRRFQQGALSTEADFRRLFPQEEKAYREVFARTYA